MIKRTFTTPVKDPEYLTKCMVFIKDTLKQNRIPSGLLTRAELLSEEIINGLYLHGSEDMDISISVKRKLGDICIDISAPGRRIVKSELNRELNDSNDNKESEKAIRAIIVKAYGERLKYTYKNGINMVSIAAGKAERSSLIATFFALALGLITGLIATLLLPEWITNAMCAYILDPIKTMFMNALKIIVGPVVFFSIVTCLSQFKNLEELGRIGAKVMGMYIITTIIASFIALLFSFLIKPGVWGAGLGTVAAQAVDIDTSADTSLLTTIINIVPNNFVRPFLESDTLQLIFLAVVCGIAVGAIGEYSERLTGLFEAANELFLAITTMFSRFIPLAAFCSVVLMMVQLGGETILYLLGMCGTFFLCVAAMMTVYGILVMLISHLNPVTFFKKAKEGILTSFALSSSSAAMPVNMRVCTEKLGISPKLVSFSIPLGATVNMDGASMNLIVMALFLARMYSVPVTGPVLVSMVVTVVMLSLGAPGVPGAGLVCLGIILEHIGVPIEAVGLIIAINPFLDMFATMNNTTGDIAVSTIVAKTENMLDTEIYNR